MEIKFIKKFICIIAIVFAGSLLMKFFVYDKFFKLHHLWGSERLYHKQQHLINTPGINTIFIGASQVMQQINPAVFDSIVSPVLQTKTFNMGENWFSASELYHALDNMLEDNSLNVKYVFIELTKIKRPDLFNLNKPRVYYWYTFKDYLFTVNTAVNSRYNFVYKGATIAAHTLGYIDNLISLGYVTEGLRFNHITRYQPNKMALGPYNNGYLIPGYKPEIPFEEQLLKVANKPNRFLKDSSAIVSKRKISEQEFSNFNFINLSSINYNKYYVQIINSMIKKYQSNGIKLIFFLPIRLDRNHYKEILPVFKAIADVHRMDVSDANIYPELYMAATSNDVTHLNMQGATIYTSLIAKKFLEKKELH